MLEGTRPRGLKTERDSIQNLHWLVCSQSNHYSKNMDSSLIDSSTYHYPVVLLWKQELEFVLSVPYPLIPLQGCSQDFRDTEVLSPSS